MTLRLPPLPDRKPVRLTLMIPPELADALQDYAAVYARAYGADEKPETLAPHMLEAFLDSDRGFKRARRALHANKTQGD